MLMLYSYRATIYLEEFQFSYSGEYSIVADTGDDRVSLLRRSVHDPIVATVLRHVLISARVLTPHEVSLLDAAMRDSPGKRPLYITHPWLSRDVSGDRARPPRIYSAVELRATEGAEARQSLILPLSPEQFAFCARYRGIANERSARAPASPR